MLTYRAVVYQWLNNVGEKSGDIVLPDLRLVAGNFQPHSDLDISELSHEFVLLRILTQPSVWEDCSKVGVR